LQRYCFETEWQQEKVKGLWQKVEEKKSGRRDSNPPPLVWETNTLPDELLPLVVFSAGYETIVLIFVLSQLSFIGISQLSSSSFFVVTTLLKNNVSGVIKLFSKA
jgi:hypothetical protein